MNKDEHVYFDFLPIFFFEHFMSGIEMKMNVTGFGKSTKFVFGWMHNYIIRHKSSYYVGFGYGAWNRHNKDVQGKKPAIVVTIK